MEYQAGCGPASVDGVDERVGDQVGSQVGALVVGGCPANHAAGHETAHRLTSGDVFDLDARTKALLPWDIVIKWQDKAKTEADFVRTRDRFS